MEDAVYGWVGGKDRKEVLSVGRGVGAVVLPTLFGWLHACTHAACMRGSSVGVNRSRSQAKSSVRWCGKLVYE